MEQLLPLVVLLSVVIGSTFAQIDNPYSGEGCDVVRACFRKPAGCDGLTGENKCEMFTSWWPTEDDTGTNFALFGNAQGYIAIGISRSPKMPDTDVYACTSQLAVKRSYNAPTGRGNDPKTLLGVTDVSVLFEDGYVKCEFVRQQFLADADDTFFNISGNNTYYSLMAIGDNLDENGDITYHDDREGSDEAVSFNNVGRVNTDRTAYRMMKAHGVIMIIAWIGFAAPGITLARYFKPAWGDVNLFGGKVWFIIHRFNMVTAFVLTTTAFIIIFVARGNFISPDEGTTRFVHAIFGCLVMGLAITNVIMAIFRPHPGEPKRKYYNWAHRSVGMLALSMSVVAMLLALNVNAPFLPNVSISAFWTLVAFVGFHLIIWLLYEILPAVITSRKAPETNDLPLSENKNSLLETEINQDPGYKRWIHRIYTVVVIGVASFVSIMVILSTQ